MVEVRVIQFITHSSSTGCKYRYEHVCDIMVAIEVDYIYMHHLSIAYHTGARTGTHTGADLGVHKRGAQLMFLKYADLNFLHVYEEKREL